MLQQAIGHLARGLVEREDQARCILLAALCGEHVLLIGPPGTAKSELARRLREVVGGRYFERLLTRFTVPEELFGPLSLAALDEGRYQREIDGYLPTATVAFLDEVFKANSAILNALLTLLHERAFDQGPQRIAVPLLTLVAASNEVPADDSLRAFHDRFLFRCPVPPVGDASFAQLLRSESGAGAGPDAAAAPVTLGRDVLQAAALQAAAVVLPGDIVAALAEARALLRELACEVSDRRWVQVVRALKVSAVTMRRAQVELADLWLLRWVLAADATQLERLETWFARALGGERALVPERLQRLAQAWDKQLEIEQTATELAFDDSGKLSLARSLGGAQDEAVSAAAPRLSAFSRRRRFSPTHVHARVAQLDAVLAELDAWFAGFEGHRRDVIEAVVCHVWIDRGFVARLQGHLQQTLGSMSGLREAIANTRAAFASLPLADVDDGVAPEPVLA